MGERLPLSRIDIPPHIAAVLPGACMYRLGECSVFVARERVDMDDLVVTTRWHISVAHPHRYPTWDEIGEARDRLVPEDVWMCMAHPPRAYWMNLHPNCLHLWEIRDRSLIEQWKAEGEDAKRIGANTPSGPVAAPPMQEEVEP